MPHILSLEATNAQNVTSVSQSKSKPELFTKLITDEEGLQNNVHSVKTLKLTELEWIEQSSDF